MDRQEELRYLKYPNELQITEDDANTAIRFAEEIKEFCQKLNL